MIVLIAVTEKQVVITDTLNATPITGRQSIFNRVAAPTEARFDVEIVGVYSNLDVTNQARAAHASAHPGRKYIQKVAALDDNIPEPVVAKCIRCGVETGGLSYCAPCQKAHWAEQREADPLGAAPDPVPVIPAAAGPDTRFVNA